MSAPTPIEVGGSTSDGKLRYWRAKEAVRQGELRLASQAVARTALEARATAITGWASAALLALVGFAFSQDVPRWAVLTSGILFFASAAVGVRAARPRDWRMAGFSPQTTLNHPGDTELEIIEGAAVGMVVHIQSNDDTLTDMARLLRLAGWLLILGPVVGAGTYALPQPAVTRASSPRAATAARHYAIGRCTTAAPDQKWLGRSSIGVGGGGGGSVAIAVLYPAGPARSMTILREYDHG